MKNIAVIGAGTMGNGIAHVFAQNNFQVTLIDVNAAQLEKALQTIDKNLSRQLSKNLITEDVKNGLAKWLKCISHYGTYPKDMNQR